MVEILAVCWFVSLIAFIIYCFMLTSCKTKHGVDSEQYITKKKKRKKIGIICLGLFLFTGAFGAITQEKVPEAEVQVVEATPEQMKADFEVFYKEFHAIDKDVKRAWNNNWVPTMNGLSTGQVDRYLAYENMKIMQEYFARQRLNASNKLSTPGSLDSEAKSKVDNAIKNYQVALAARCDAAEAMRDLLNKGNINPSDLDDVKWKLGMAESSEAEAAKSIAEVAQQLGANINIEE